MGGDVASVSLPPRGDVSSPCTGTIVACGLRGQRLTDGPRAARACEQHTGEDGGQVLFLLFPFSSSIDADSRFLRQLTVDNRNRLPMAEINHRRLILAVSPSSGRSAYRSAVGPVCTGWYWALPLGKENLGGTTLGTL
ncbi:hypothetical protein B296_00025926 [Ensete ventricosum]|uniref:Uncharacterized protein n=1 Tax=Ensete ventricosum TaxID=4639 RepID=A0A426ZVF9_ENSVE|nr:hypothetical protein B296_00025926 [Ensete ventricosum]